MSSVITDLEADRRWLLDHARELPEPVMRRFISTALRSCGVRSSGTKTVRGPNGTRFKLISPGELTGLMVDDHDRQHAFVRPGTIRIRMEVADGTIPGLARLHGLLSLRTRGPGRRVDDRVR